MIKQLFLLFAGVLCILISSTSACAHQGYDHWGYPHVDSVRAYLSTRINTDMYRTDQHIILVKRPGGWYFCAAEYEYMMDVRRTPEIPCWDRATRQYVYRPNSPVYKPSPDVMRDFKRMCRTEDPRFYSQDPYYGYDQWIEDTQALLADSAHLDDINLEALGRTYGREMADRLSIYSNYRSFHLGSYPGHMTAAQIDTIRRLNKLGCETFKRLWQQNPNYTAYIFNIWSKYSDERVFGFLQLAFYQDINTGLPQLGTEELYDPIEITLAKNTLASCDKDAILFTEADRDTYPLYYIQARMNYRRDVLVINKGMMDLPAYVNFMRKGYWDAPGMPMRMDTSAYSGYQLEILTPDSGLYGKYNTIKGIDRIQDSDAIYKSDIMLSDIISANNWKRPIHFSLAVNDNVVFGLQPNLIRQGWVYRLQRKASTAKKVSEAPCDPDYGYDFVMHRFAMRDWSKQRLYDATTLRIPSFEAYNMMKIANALYDKGRKKECIEVLDKMNELLPAGKIPRDFFFADGPELYIKCGAKKEKADTMVKVIINDSNSEFERLTRDKYINNYDWNWNAQSCMYSIQQMIEYIRKHTADQAKADAMQKDLEDKYAVYLELQKERGMQ